MSTSNSYVLGEAEFRALLELTSQMGEMPQDRRARRLHAARRLCRLVRGLGATFFEVKVRQDRWSVVPGTVHHTNLSATEAEVVDQMFAGRRAADPMLPHLTKLSGASVTLTRRGLIRDFDWYRHPHFAEVRRPLGVDDTIYSRIELVPGHWFCLCIQRGLGEDPFTERDVRIVDIFHQAAARLYLDPTPDQGALETAPKPKASNPQIEQLAPRLRPVLDRLLDGDSEKQASQRLGLSPHTVHQYVKTLYKHFRVSSRGELLSQFVSVAG